MEYGLGLPRFIENDEGVYGLNPCFNGIWSRTASMAAEFAALEES